MKDLTSLDAAGMRQYTEQLDLLNLLNEKEYNLYPFLSLLETEYSPFALSEKMLALHFNLSYYLALHADECTPEDIHNHLYTIQQLYYAFRQMEYPTREVWEKM